MSKSQPVVEGETQPLPCYLCDALPKVGAIQLMTGNTVWTCLCPNHCYETDAYYDREGAIEAWNLWVESEGWMDDGYEDLEDEARSELAREEGWEW